MMRRLLPLAAIALLCAGCDGPQKTIDKLRAEIAEYKANPSDQQQQLIDADFARLDSQIDTLEEKGKNDEAAAMRASESNLRADYRAAKMVRAMKETQEAIQDVGNAFKEAGKTIGNVFRNTEGTPTPSP